MENYKKVTTIDELDIFVDKKGYFIFEHYPVSNGHWYSIPTYLGERGEEVHRAISDYNDWNYRSWHGEMEKIIKYCEQADALPYFRDIWRKAK